TEDRGEARVPAAEAVLRAGLSRLGGLPIGPIGTHLSVPLATFDNESRWLAVADSGGRITIRDLQTAAPTATPVVLHHGDQIVSLSFDASGRWLITHAAPDDDLRSPITIRCWDGSAAWEPHDVGVAHGSPFTCASLSVERTHLATGTADG